MPPHIFFINKERKAQPYPCPLLQPSMLRSSAFHAKQVIPDLHIPALKRTDR